MWEQRFVDTSRGTFEVFVQGKGEPLCVTHLYSEFTDLGYYFADPFVENFTVYLVNLKSAGNSCKAEAEEELSMKESVNDLEAIREALGFDHWAFAGHSTGGMLGLVYATSYPASLTKIMIGGATATRSYMDHEGSIYSPNSPLHKQLKAIFEVLKSSESTKEERSKANKAWTDMSLYNAKKRDDYFKKPSSGKVVQRRLDYFSFVELPHFDVRKELAAVHVPAIVYCGRHDAQCPLVFSEEIYEALAQSTLYIFEYSNHLPYLEEEEKFKEMIGDFRDLALNVKQY